MANIHYSNSGGVGPQGPVGAQGNVGPTGPSVTGPTGPQGNDGATGPTGSTGATGPSGTNGTNGAVGATGPTGATGPSGVASVTYQTYNPNFAGTGLAYTGTPAVGYYTTIGKLVHFHIQVALTTVTNFGTGQYLLNLPLAPIGDYAFRDGGIHGGGNHYALMADAEAGTVTMDLWYIESNGQDQAMDHNSPRALTVNDKFYINGTYLIP
jgi:hypothetical protein